MHCHNTSSVEGQFRQGNIALIGHANVGKSVIFQKMTGVHAVVSNYPGTTVDISRGSHNTLPEVTILDTPGIVTLPAHTEDEKATAQILLVEQLQAIVQVGDAKNIARTLVLTIQLLEMGVPLVLSLNMMDEAADHGIAIDAQQLTRIFDIPIVPTIAVRGQGIRELNNNILRARPHVFNITYPPAIEKALQKMESIIPKLNISSRSAALLFLSSDSIIEARIAEELDDMNFQQLTTLRDMVKQEYDEPLSSIIQQSRFAFADQLAQKVQKVPKKRQIKIKHKIGNLAIHPIWGLPILALVLWFTYWFVGVFGAGTLVDYLETQVFGEWINPWIVSSVNRLIPAPILVDFIVGEYGLWTMAITYAIVLILPIVTTFFLMFGILEDSGYLPRLAVLSNRYFLKLGLNGKAVLPMVLGLGCVTMATLTTRTLESKRDRFLVTLLLALGVPCSAQLGVVMGMLAGISFTATLIWVVFVLMVLFVVGWLAAKVVPGERQSLLLELPPMRFPQFSNILIKTLARLEWYIKEVIPLFLIGAALMFVLDSTGVLPWLIKMGEPLTVNWLGLPGEASAAFLLGFLRRDFGATGLFILESQGLMSASQIVVAMVTITLFIPCIASVMIIQKEHGWRKALGMILFVFPLAFFVGGILFRLLSIVGWGA